MTIVKGMTIYMVVCTLACAALYLIGATRAAELETATTLNTELKESLAAATTIRGADTAAGNAKAVSSVISNKRKESENARLKDAIKATPTWSDSEVPASVAAALSM